jgi:membrane fusion protein (multidrug efflux system)
VPQKPPAHRGKPYRRLAVAAVAIICVLIALAYFQLALKPELIKSGVSSTPPRPVTVTAEPARTEQWVSRLRSIGTVTAIKGVEVAPQVGGLVAAIKFESGDTVAADTPSSNSKMRSSGPSSPATRRH